MIIAIIISLALGVLIGIKLTTWSSKTCIIGYLMSEGRTFRVGNDLARLILSGIYVKEYNKSH